MILLRVAIFFLLMLLLPDWYIHRIYLKNRGSKIYKRILWGPTIGLLVLLAIFIAMHDSLHDYFGIYLIVTLCFCIPKLTFVIFSLLLRGLNRITGLNIPHAAVSALPALAMLGYILFGAIKGKENFKVREVTFYSPTCLKNSTDTVFCNCRTYTPEVGKAIRKLSKKLLTCATDRMPTWLFSQATL